MGFVDPQEQILHLGADGGSVREAVGLITDDRVTVESTDTPRAARDVLNRRDIAGLVCEESLPEGSGLAFLDAVRESHPALPVLFVAQDRSTVDDAIAAGATDVYVRRPDADGSQVLARRLENVLAAHRPPVSGDDGSGSDGGLADEGLTDLLLDALDDAFYLVDTAGNLVRWNDQFAAVTGYSDEELAGMHALDFFEGADRERVSDAIETARETGSVSLEASLVTSDGDRIPFSWTGALLTDADGTARGIVGIGRDVADRKEREQQLELAETVFQQAQDAIFLVDVVDRETFRVQRVNPAYEQLTGLGTAEIRGHTPTEILGEQRGAEVEARYRDCLRRREPIEYEERLAFDGEPRVWQTSLAPVTDDGEVVKLVGATRDITEREERERELEREHDRLAAVFDATPYPFVHVEFEDGEPIIQRANDAFEAVFGYDTSTLVGTSLDEHIVPDGDPDAEEINSRVQRGDGIEREVTRTTADGEHREFLFRAASLSHGDDTVEGIAAYVDITERKRRIEQLRQIRQNVSEVVWMSSPGKDRMEFISDSYEDVWGRSTESLREDPRSFVEAIHPEDRDRVEDALETQKRDPDAYEETYRVVRPDGEVRWVHDRASGVYEDGELRRIVGIASDITGRKEREQQLRIRTRAMDEAPVGITLSDPTQEDNPLIYANDKFTSLTGYPAEEIQGHNCRFLQGEDTDPETVAAVRRAVDAAEPVSVELRNYRKDGTEFWNQLTVAPVEDEAGEVTNYVGFQQDVTDRKERERELRLRTRAMAEAPVGITIHDATAPGAPITYANEAFEQLTGYRQSSLEGESIALLAGAETDEERFDRVEAALDRGEHASEVVLLYRRDGSPFWGRTSLAPVADGDGEITQFVGFLQDVTETKEHEQQIQRRLNEFGELLAEDLRLPVQDATARLEAAKESGDPAEIEAAERAFRQIDSLIEDLSTVHSDAVKSRDVFDDAPNATGDR